MARWTAKRNSYGGFHTVTYLNQVSGQVFECGDLPSIDPEEVIAWIVSDGQAQAGDSISFCSGKTVQVMPRAQC